MHTFVGSNQMYLSSLVWLSSRSDILHCIDSDQVDEITLNKTTVIGIDSEPVREILFTMTTVMLITSMAIKVLWSAVQRFCV